MQIRKLILSNFGKFKNFQLPLENGVNVIYGENEKGKTTIHKFIEGIFFGFFLPYRKNRQYSGDYNKYLPWNGNLYNGSLIYEFEGKSYQLNRNLLKGKDSVSLFNEETTEEMTTGLPYNENIRLHEPSVLHLGISSLVYRNTISVNQLGSRTEANFAEEVKQSLVNYGGSKDEKIPVVRILKSLSEKIEKIGTERTKVKPLGIATSDLEDLERELEVSKTQYKTLSDITLEIKKINEEIIDVNSKINQNNQLIKEHEELLLKSKYNNAAKILGDIAKIENDLSSLKEYQSLNKADYGKIKELDSKLKNYSEQRDKFLQKLKDDEELFSKFSIKLEEKAYIDKEQLYIENVAATYSKYSDDVNRFEDNQNAISDLLARTSDKKEDQASQLKDDYYTYLGLDEKLRSLQEIKANSEQDQLQLKIEKSKGEVAKSKAFLTIIGAFTLIGIIMGIIVSPFIFGILAISIPSFFIKLRSLKKIKNGITDLKSRMQTVKQAKTENSSTIISLEQEMMNILLKHNCTNKINLQKLFDNKNAMLTLRDEYIKQSERLVSENAKLKDEINKRATILRDIIANVLGLGDISSENIEAVRNIYKEYLQNKLFLTSKAAEINRNKNEIEDISVEINKINIEHQKALSDNFVRSIEEYENAYIHKSEFDEKAIQLEHLRDNLSNVLDKYTFDELKTRVNSIPEGNSDAELIVDMSFDLDMLKAESSELSRKLNEIHNRSGMLEESSSQIEQNFREMSVIEADIKEKMEIKTNLSVKKDALSLAQQLIEKASKNIQREFAPKLNLNVASMINKITGGKYTELKIDSDLKIRVNDSFTGNIVDIDDLSTGTIDQIYLSTRFGVINTIKGDVKLPIILDDCFVNYDNLRLLNAIKYISEECEDSGRQVIIFTCQEREAEALNLLGKKYNLFNL